METKIDTTPKKCIDNIAVWQEFQTLGSRYSAVSLGQGAPSVMPPKFLIDELNVAIQDGHNQYTRTFGHPILAQALA